MRKSVVGTTLNLIILGGHSEVECSIPGTRVEVNKIKAYSLKKNIVMWSSVINVVAVN